MSDIDPKAVALAKHLGVDVSTVSECRYGTDMWESDEEPGEYLVLTDDEADAAFHSYMESYIDDCVLDRMPEDLRSYFDSERFIRDVRLSDGRGPNLAHYDGAEEEEKVDDVWYFIYRTN